MRAMRVFGLTVLMYLGYSFAQTMAAPGFVYEQAKWNGREFVSTGHVLFQCESDSWLRCTLQF
jgi:hypothetical protein